MGLDSFLTGRIPHTEVTLGMSRRLYATCAELFQADQKIAERTPGLCSEDGATEVEEEELEERSTATRREYRERQEEARPIVQRRLREVFAASRDQPWEHRLVDTPQTLVRLRRAVRRYPALVTAHRRTGPLVW